MLRAFALKLIDQNNKANKTKNLQNVQNIVKGLGKLLSTGLKKDMSSEHKKQLLGTVLFSNKRVLEDFPLETEISIEQDNEINSLNDRNKNNYSNEATNTSKVEWSNDLDILESNISHKPIDKEKVLKEYKVPDSSFSRIMMMGKTALSMGVDIGVSRLTRPFVQGMN
jgi:hypothetical protein